MNLSYIRAFYRHSGHENFSFCGQLASNKL